MSVTIRYAPVDLTFRGLQAEDDFSFTISDTPSGDVGSVTEAQVTADMFAKTTVLPAADNNFRISVEDSPTHPGHWFENLDPDYCTVDTQGNVALKYPAGQNRQVTVEVSAATGSRRVSRIMHRSIDEFVVATRYVAGSLANHIVEQVTGLIAGKSNPTMTDGGVGTGLLDRISAWNPSAGEVALNPNCFCHGLEASGIPVVMGTDASGHGGSLVYVPGISFDTTSAALITSRHILSGHTGSPSKHFVFRGNDGSFHVRKAVGYTRISSTTGPVIGLTEDYLSYLDDDLPASVVPFKIMPDGWQTRYMPGLTLVHTSSSGVKREVARLPVIMKGHRGPDSGNGVPFNGDLFKLSNLGLPGVDISSPALISDIGFDLAWAPPGFAGDSSGPVLFLINGQLVLLMMTHGARWSVTGDIWYTPSQVQSLCDHLAGDSTRQVQTVDLSGFTDFS